MDTVNDPLAIPEVPPDCDTLKAAIAYAEAGWYVGPVLAGTKRPALGSHWQEQTSQDPEEIAAWYPGTNHGVFLHVGKSGAVVLDVDHPDRLHPDLRRAIEETEPPHQSTRPDEPRRGHYLFAVPEGVVFGNGLGSLAAGWGEVRGRNGLIVAAPTQHPDGGRYEWRRTGSLPVLPSYVADRLPDPEDAAQAATAADVAAFLSTHVEGSRPELLDLHVGAWSHKVAAGESRHDTMTGHLAGAMKEAGAGYLSAQAAADTLESLFLAAVTRDGHGRQGAARTLAEARLEWAGLLSWAVGQAEAADLDAVRTRTEQVLPEVSTLGAEEERAGVAPVVTLEEVHQVFARWLGADYDLDVLDTVLAVAAVDQLDGDPPWLLVVSGSGAAKTETVAPLAAAGAHVTSTIASEGALLSGTSRKERSKTATGGLLRKIGPSGVLVIKDVTSVLSMNRDARGAVLAALREVYDGKWERNLGSDGGQSLTWVGRIVVIGAVTTAWDKAHAVVASMGDRFVLIRLDSRRGRVASGRQAIANTGEEEAMRRELGAAVAGVLAGVNPEADTSPTDEDSALILAVADVVTLGRTGVEHDYRGDVIDAHAPEMPTRFAKQLTQVLRGGLALGIDRAHMMRIVGRCAADSMPPLRLAVMLDLQGHPDSTTQEVRQRLDKPRATVDRILQALHILGLATLHELVQGDTRTVWRYSLAPDVDLDALRHLELSQECQNPHTAEAFSLLHPNTPYSNKSGATPGSIRIEDPE